MTITEQEKMRAHTEKNTKQSYMPPFIELTEIVVEKGFAQSPQEIGSPKIEWEGGTENCFFDDEF